MILDDELKEYFSSDAYIEQCKYRHGRYYKMLQRYALQSEFWGRKYFGYFTTEYYDYAPMIDDELFTSLFDKKDIVGVEAIEKALGRKLKIEELKATPLSVDYFLFEHPIITGTQDEEKRIEEFEEIILSSIRRAEKRTIGYELKRLKKLYEHS